VLGVGLRLFPGLAGAPVVETWAGFRPHTPDGLPVLGPAPVPGLFLASGHFRNGILLTTITAALLTDAILGRPTGIDLAPFRADRTTLSGVTVVNDGAHPEGVQGAPWRQAKAES
jgi:glycine oxidase